MLKGIRDCAFLLFVVMSLLASKPNELGEPWTEIGEFVDAREYTAALAKLQEYASSNPGVEILSETYYRIGFIHYEYTHEYDKALDAYQKVVDLGEKSKSTSDIEPFLAFSRMSIAHIYRRIGQYDAAITMYKSVAASYPETEYAMVAAKYIGGIQDAQTELKLQQQIIDKYPSTEFAAEAQFRIAELYLSMQHLNNPQQAILEYARVVEKYPNSRRAAEAQLKIGNTYRTILNRPEDAISAYKKLVPSRSASRFSSSKLGAEALFQIGRLYYSDLHNYKKALEAFNRFLKDYPTYWKYPAAVYWQGMCYEQLKEYDNAIGSFELFVQMYPDKEPSWLADIGRLGAINLKSQMVSKVEELKRLAMEVRWSEAERLCSTGNYREAIDIYYELMRDYPNSEYSSKAKSESEKVRYLVEIQVCRDIVRNRDSESPASQYRMAEIYEIELQDYAQAIDEYEKVLTNYPDTYWAVEALYRIGTIYSGNRQIREDKRRKPDYAKAIEKFNQLIHQYPYTYTAAEAYYQLGEIYRVQLNDYNRALEAYAKVVKDYPKRGLYIGDGYEDSLADEAQFMIGRIYYENLQDYDMALKAFIKFLKDYPESCRKAAAYSFTAAIQERQRENKAAVDSLEQIINIVIGSDIQASFFIRDALYEDRNLANGSSNSDLQKGIIKHIKSRIFKLQGGN